RLAEVKSSRDNDAVQAALTDLEKAARGNENMMPAIMTAVKAYATVGEMNAVMQSVFGSFKEPIRF
ncbi:MAG: methylmalonyl-CoA mutase, partial [Fimbriimonadaceae bacterium]|nr:methylmalonyl-CoA mutase [Alphaproteobacteria bacterium]